MGSLLSVHWSLSGLRTLWVHKSRLTQTFAGSRIPGTERSSALTSGHAGVEFCIQEEHGGYGRIWPDTLPRLAQQRSMAP
jgi:hypothetical protein